MKNQQKKSAAEIKQEDAVKAYLGQKTKNNKSLYQNLKKEAQDQAEKRKELGKKPKGKMIKLVALENLSGRFKLPYSTGQSFSINENQAKELIEKKAAEKTK